MWRCLTTELDGAPCLCFSGPVLDRYRGSRGLLAQHGSMSDIAALGLFRLPDPPPHPHPVCWLKLSSPLHFASEQHDYKHQAVMGLIGPKLSAERGGRRAGPLPTLCCFSWMSASAQPRASLPFSRRPCTLALCFSLNIYIIMLHSL